MKSDVEDVDNSTQPIFLHSQFRCGSTFLFNRFRSSEQFYTFYEPLHHDLIRLRRNKLDLWGFDSKTTGKVNHPVLKKPHFSEFQACFKTDQNKLPFFDKGYSYDQFYEVADEGFNTYIKNLLKSAPAGKRTVLQFNRTSMRVDWFAENISNGINITLIRNPRDQFDSYANTGNDVFLIMNLIIISRSSHFNPFAKLTRELLLGEYRSDAIKDEIKHYSKIAKSLPLNIHYKIFLNIWIESYRHSLSYTDLVINMNRISRDSEYRKDVEEKVGYVGLFDGYDLKVNRKHRLKDREIFKIENDVLCEEDEMFISDLRKEYYFDEQNDAVSSGALINVLETVGSKASAVLSMKKANKNKSAPVISIITPSYNQAQFIDDTIKSVLEQRGEFYIDYIIVDGLSDDGTVEIVESNQACCNNGDYEIIGGLKFYKNEMTQCSGISFRYISETDTGQSNALNKGFKLAIGELFGWLNSDDFYYSGDALSYVVKGFANKSTNFLYGRGIRVDRDGFFVREEAYVRNFRPGKIKYVDFILQPSAFWRRKVYEDIGLLNESYHYVFDWDYWIRVSERFDLKINNNILSCYRVYSETKTSAGGDERENEIIALLQSYSSYNKESVRLNRLEKIN